MIRNRIKEIRVAMGWTQEDLQVCSGVSDSSIGRYENEECVPNLFNALSICKALGKTLDQVFYDDKEAWPA